MRKSKEEERLLSLATDAIDRLNDIERKVVNIQHTLYDICDWIDGLGPLEIRHDIKKELLRRLGGS